MDSNIDHFRKLLEAVTLDDGGALADSCPFSAAEAVAERQQQLEIDAAGNSRQILVASYDRRVLGQTGVCSEWPLACNMCLHGMGTPCFVVALGPTCVPWTFHSFATHSFDAGEGHFSPVAAYCPSQDKVLMMDVARFKYPPHWVDVNLLWEAMSAINNWNNKSRGYFALEKSDMSVIVAA